MESDGLSEDRFFQIAAFTNEVWNRVAVVDPSNVLVDDRAFVKIGRCVVCSGTDEFDASGVCLVVRLTPSESWQEGVVDVDHGASGFVQEAVGEYLHVASHNDEFCAVLVDDTQLLGLGFSFGRFAYRNVVERQAVVFGVYLQIRVIGDNTSQLARHLTGAEAQDRVVEAVVDLGNEERDLRPVGRLGDFSIHSELNSRKLFKAGRFFVDLPRGNPLDALEENFGLRISVLIGMDNVTPPQKDPTGHARDETRLVGAV